MEERTIKDMPWHLKTKSQTYATLHTTIQYMYCPIPYNTGFPSFSSKFFQDTPKM